VLIELVIIILTRLTSERKKQAGGMGMGEKLVRDKMPEFCTRPGRTPITVRKAKDSVEYVEVVLNKLSEETQEVRVAAWEHLAYGNTQAIIEELADLTEVMQTILKIFNITPEEIEAARIKKLDERGGFDNGIIWDGKK
jgi:predicted house-cleaning noncanonical NTP pyrophosphatase (MazG superfamily)